MDSRDEEETTDFNSEDVEDVLASMGSPPPPTFRIHSPDGEELFTMTEKPLMLTTSNTELADAILPLIDLPPPPDGGWGWVVCVASFMCNLILDGVTYTFGILLEPLVTAFGSNRSTVSWVGSLLAGWYLLSGPLVGGLVNKFGCRPVCIGGSIVACLGLALSTLAPNVPVLMLTYGFVGGVGLGLIYLPAVVAVGYYFERKRALATGISVCGSGVGTFIFPPLATLLLEEYGWKGTNLIFAGLCLNCIVFGALMRPLELTVRRHDEDEEPPEGQRHALNNDFTVLLPDGTHHRQLSESSAHEDTNFATLNINDVPPSMNFSTHLPTIVEQTVTKEEEVQKKKSVQEVFSTPSEQPLQAEEETASSPPTVAASTIQRPSFKGSRRKRTISEGVGYTTSSKFHVTQVKEDKAPSGGAASGTSIPRNSTAPNFVDPNAILSRNASSVGLGGFGLGRMSSNDHHIFFGLQGSQLLSNTTLHLEPHHHHSGHHSRRGSRPIVRPLYRKDVFYSGSVMHLIDKHQAAANNNVNVNNNIVESNMKSQVPSFANLEEYRHSVLSIPRSSRRQSVFSMPRSSIVASHLSIPPAIRKASLIDGQVLESEGQAPIMSALREMVNVDLLKNKVFLLVGISNVFGMLGFYTPFVYLPNMAALRGIPLEDANFLISIIGISNTFGRVFSGWLSDFSWVNSLVVTNMAIFFSGLCVLVFPFCQSYAALVVVSLLFGLFVSAYVSLTSIILVDLLGLDNLTSAFGLLVLFRGVSTLIGPPLAGSLYDATQSFDISFYISGLSLFLAAAVSVLVDVINRRATSKKK